METAETPIRVKSVSVFDLWNSYAAATTRFNAANRKLLACDWSDLDALKAARGEAEHRWMEMRKSLEQYAQWV